jgi:hypothetical protein
MTKPSYQFKIDSPELLQNASAFSLLNINTKDSLSLQLNALKIYQSLLLSHMNNTDKRALVRIDLERLLFVKQHATFKTKEALYLETLKASQETYKTTEASALYAFEIAQIQHLEAKNKKEGYRFKNLEAIAICEEILEKFPGSLGAKKCKILKSQIEQKNLEIRAEKQVPINKNSLFLIRYKNMDSLYFTSYKIHQKDLLAFRKMYKSDEKIKFIQQLEKYKSWNVPLRNEGDYLPHKTEIIIPKLEGGSYVIISSESKELNAEKIVGITTIQSTNLSLIENNFDRKKKLSSS